MTEMLLGLGGTVLLCVLVTLFSWYFCRDK